MVRIAGCPWLVFRRCPSTVYSLLVMVHKPTPIAKHWHALVSERDPERFGVTHVHKAATPEWLRNINHGSDPNTAATTLTVWRGVYLFDLPSKDPMASALTLFMRLSGRLWICIQKEAVSNLASSTDSDSLGL